MVEGSGTPPGGSNSPAARRRVAQATTSSSSSSITKKDTTTTKTSIAKSLNNGNSDYSAEYDVDGIENPDENVPLLVEQGDEPVIVTGVSEDDIEREWEGASWWKRPHVYWLLFPFALFTTAYGGISVPKLNVILELICRDYLIDKNLLPPGSGVGFTIDPGSECQAPEIQALVSRFALYLQLIAGILGAITSPNLGAYSDRIGRRYILALSSLGLLSSEVTTVLAMKYPQYFSVNLLLFGAVIDGLSGSFMLALAVAHSYAADCSSVKDRAVSFGLFQGTLFLGIALGPALSGVLIKRTGNVLVVFYIALAAHALFILYIFLILPESLTQGRIALHKRKHAQKKLIRAEHLANNPPTLFERIAYWNPFKPLSIFYPTGPGSSPRLRWNLVILATTDALFYGVAMGGVTVIIIYAQSTFGWHNYESSMFMAITSFLRVVLLFVVLPLGVKALRWWQETREGRIRLGVDAVEDVRHSGADGLDISLIRFAILTELFGYLGFFLSTTGTQYTLAGLLTALGGVGSPTVRSALTKHIQRDRTGQLLGASALLHSLARIVFPMFCGLVYAETVVRGDKRTVFVCLAAVFLGMAGLSGLVTTGVKLHEDDEGNMIDGDHVTEQLALPVHVDGRR